MEKIHSLIQVLLDLEAPISDRDDAALDLGLYNDDRALNALLKVASNPYDNTSIRDVCGESIAQIWVQRNDFDITSFKMLLPESKNEIRTYFKNKKPEWLKKIQDL